MRSREPVIRYKSNPYTQKDQNRAHSAMIYQPDEYHLSLMGSLTPSALRLFVLLASTVSPETGRSNATTKQLRDYLSGMPCNISRAKTELQKAGLIARAGLSAYWINPKVFRPITVTL